MTQTGSSGWRLTTRIWASSRGFWRSNARRIADQFGPLETDAEITCGCDSHIIPEISASRLALGQLGIK